VWLLLRVSLRPLDSDGPVAAESAAESNHR
jgi:hypothetical protein